MRRNFHLMVRVRGEGTPSPGTNPGASARSRYSGCHKYVPFAGFSNRRKYNVERPEIIINMTTAILFFY
ncbi:MAG: hypothetical protein V3U02_11820 [Calditrichia bacterium]